MKQTAGCCGQGRDKQKLRFGCADLALVTPRKEPLPLPPQSQPAGFILRKASQPHRSSPEAAQPAAKEGASAPQAQHCKRAHTRAHAPTCTQFISFPFPQHSHTQSHTSSLPTHLHTITRHSHYLILSLTQTYTCTRLYILNSHVLTRTTTFVHNCRSRVPLKALCCSSCPRLTRRLRR